MLETSMEAHKHICQMIHIQLNVETPSRSANFSTWAFWKRSKKKIVLRLFWNGGGGRLEVVKKVPKIQQQPDHWEEKKHPQHMGEDQWTLPNPKACTICPHPNFGCTTSPCTWPSMASGTTRCRRCDEALVGTARILRLLKTPLFALAIGSGNLQDWSSLSQHPVEGCRCHNEHYIYKKSSSLI